MDPASNPGPRNLVSVAVAAAGVLQPLSNFKFANEWYLRHYDERFVTFMFLQAYYSS